MHCAKCKVNKIGPNTEPFGGYLCANEHLQCTYCDRRTPGVCGVCNSYTNFVQMNVIETAPESKRSRNGSQPHPSATPMACGAHGNYPSANITSYLFPKVIFADLETQSSISQEKLSMHESQSSKANNRSESAECELGEKPPMFNRSFTKVQSAATEASRTNEAEAMKTIFIGHQQPQQSAVNLNFFEQNGARKGAADIAQNLQSQDSPKDLVGVTNEENEDTNIIHTSEIRFMESTESLQNYYSGGTVHPVLKHPKHDEYNATHTSPQDTLSARMLHDFECHNMANPSDLVENYLRSYGPLAVCHIPAYSIGHNCYHPFANEAWTPQQRQALMRSISVSTDSEPVLTTQSRSSAPRVAESPDKYQRPEYVVMQATVVADSPPVASIKNLNKLTHFSLDQRMQKVLGTLQEDPHHTAEVTGEKPLLEPAKNYVKISTPETSFSLAAPAPVPVSPTDGDTSACGLSEKPSENLRNELSNSHRAFYNPSTEQNVDNSRSPTAISKRSLTVQPPPQFQLISCPALLANEMLASRPRSPLTKPLPAYRLNIPRSPIRCPESTCPRIVFVSDFSKHMAVDHIQLTTERISPRQCKNFFLDPRVARIGVNKCHLVYLIRDKIIDLGSSKYKDLLPMLVMSTRVRLADLCGNPELAGTGEDVSFLMIWVTGLVPKEFPVYVSLTIWPHSGRVPTCHIVHSGEIYSVRSAQTVTDVCRSGQMLLLSEKELQVLTRDGKDMLEMQVVVH